MAPDAASCDPLLVSVIIPAYNAARFLPETLASARAQTYPRVEIIVIDDGSTDATPDIAARAAEGDARVRLVGQENAGTAAARNRGIEVARGELIAPLDADDLWHPQFLELMVGALQASPADTAVAYSWSCVIDDQGEVLDYHRAPAFRDGRELFLAMAERLIIGNASASIVRSEAARRVDGYSSFTRRHGLNNGCTRTFYVKLARQYRFVCVPKFLVGYRRHGTAMSSDLVNHERARALLIDEILRLFPEIPRQVGLQWRAKWHLQRIGRLLRDGSRWHAGLDLLRLLGSEPALAARVLRLMPHRALWAVPLHVPRRKDLAGTYFRDLSRGTAAPLRAGIAPTPSPARASLT